MEFALVVPIAILILFLAISAGGLMYANSMLHFATQDAARCGAVKTNICTDVVATQTYAANRYNGPTVTPVFVATMTPACSRVTASATYNVNTGVAQFPVSLNASACYPLQPS